MTKTAVVKQVQGLTFAGRTDSNHWVAMDGPRDFGGSDAGIRPKDLVGAIAGETSLSGRDVGSIEIADRFALVEVPDGAVDEVIDAMRRTTIKGKKVAFRRERFTPGR